MAQYMVAPEIRNALGVEIIEANSPEEAVEEFYKMWQEGDIWPPEQEPQFTFQVTGPDGKTTIIR